MVKIVVCDQYGMGFGVPAKFHDRLNELRKAAGLIELLFTADIKREARTCPHFIRVVEEMREEGYILLNIVEIPDVFHDTYRIRDYEGRESVEYNIDHVVGTMMPSIGDLASMPHAEAHELLVSMCMMRNMHVEQGLCIRYQKYAS